MATLSYTLTLEWAAANRYTAAAEQDVLLSNSGTYPMYFAITADDTPPTVASVRAHPLPIYASRAMQLQAGERLWLAGYAGHAALAT